MFRFLDSLFLSGSSCSRFIVGESSLAVLSPVVPETTVPKPALGRRPRSAPQNKKVVGALLCLHAGRVPERLKNTKSSVPKLYLRFHATEW